MLRGVGAKRGMVVLLTSKFLTSASNFLSLEVHSVSVFMAPSKPAVYVEYS